PTASRPRRPVRMGRPGRRCARSGYGRRPPEGRVAPVGRGGGPGTAPTPDPSRHAGESSPPPENAARPGGPRRTRRSPLHFLPQQEDLHLARHFRIGIHFFLAGHLHFFLLPVVIVVLGRPGEGVEPMGSVDMSRRSPSRGRAKGARLGAVPASESLAAV